MDAAGAVKGSMTKPDWAHVFLTVLDPLPLHQPQQEGLTAAALRAACAGLMSKHSSRLRRAGVVQWEVRLPMPDALPAWRVVVSSPTGESVYSRGLFTLLKGILCWKMVIKALECVEGLFISSKGSAW